MTFQRERERDSITRACSPILDATVPSFLLVQIKPSGSGRRMARPIPEPLGTICNEQRGEPLVSRPRDQKTAGCGDENGQDLKTIDFFSFWACSNLRVSETATFSTLELWGRERWKKSQVALLTRKFGSIMNKIWIVLVLHGRTASAKFPRGNWLCEMLSPWRNSSVYLRKIN